MSEKLKIVLTGKFEIAYLWKFIANLVIFSIC